MTKRAMTAHVKTRMALRELACELLETKVGFPLVEDPVKGPESGFIWPGADRLFYESVLKYAMMIQDRIDAPSSINLVPSQSHVKLELAGRYSLAKVPAGMQEVCKEKLIQAYTELSKSDAMSAIARTYKQLVPITEEAKTLVEEISLFGMLPGRCRVCQRMGS